MVLIVHWIADFVFQSDRMAKGKSSDFIILSEHVAVYTAVWIAVLLAIGMGAGIMSLEYLVFIIKFAGITFLSHLAIDYYTSKTHTQLWKEEKVHIFFTSIGFDQLLHYAQLFITLNIFK